jgi:hypothetical protein
VAEGHPKFYGFDLGKTVNEHHEVAAPEPLSSDLSPPLPPTAIIERHTSKNQPDASDALVPPSGDCRTIHCSTEVACGPSVLSDDGPQKVDWVDAPMGHKSPPKQGHPHHRAKESKE